MSEREGRDDAANGTEALPEVLFLDDVAALLRCSPSTIKRRLRARVFPVAPLPGIDKRHRWSKTAVLEWLAVEHSDGMPARSDAAGWSVAYLEAGDPVFVCPSCWPAVAAYWCDRADATVRVVGRRPAWARCGVCDPERVC